MKINTTVSYWNKVDSTPGVSDRQKKLFFSDVKHSSKSVRPEQFALYTKLVEKVRVAMEFSFLRIYHDWNNDFEEVISSINPDEGWEIIGRDQVSYDEWSSIWQLSLYNPRLEQEHLALIKEIDELEAQYHAFGEGFEMAITPSEVNFSKLEKFINQRDGLIGNYKGYNFEVVLSSTEFAPQEFYFRPEYRDGIKIAEMSLVCFTVSPETEQDLRSGKIELHTLFPEAFNTLLA